MDVLAGPGFAGRTNLHARACERVWVSARCPLDYNSRVLTSAGIASIPLQQWVVDEKQAKTQMARQATKETTAAPAVAMQEL